MLLKEVVFNCASVKEIGNYAFKGCLSLSAFDLTTVEKLGSNVFMESALMELYIPLTVTYIGNQIFVDCLYDGLIVYCEANSKPSAWANNWSYGAYQVIWGENQGGDDTDDTEETAEFNYYFDSNYAVVITGCVGKGVVTVPSTIDGYTVKTISANAFSGQYEITEIIIPSSVNVINVTAFDDCTALQKITHLGTYTEYRTNDGVLYGDYGRSIVKYPEGKRDTEFTVPYNVDIIRTYAFKNNTYLKKITLPSDIENDNYVGKIELGAFQGCVSLETVDGLAVGYFDKEAFRDCHNLKELTFLAPEISFIMNQAFLSCTSLESITFKGNVGIINWQSFGYCTNLKNITFEGTLEKLGWGAFEYCSILESIVIPDGTTVIGGEAFKDCSMLENVTISSTVATIEKNAFTGTNIKKIFIPITVTQINEFAFEGLEGVVIYCEVSSKPTDWNENWNAISSEDELGYYEVKWNQTELPNE